MGEKQQWSNEHIKCLLETCIEEINSVGKKGLSLHKDSWIKLGRVLKEKFGLDLTQKQMKNAYDNLKAKYIGWVYLKNKTGNIYNAETNTFTLTNEEWEEFKKGHPKAGALKTVPLPFPDLCAALFDGNTATGNCKWTSTQTTSMVGSSSCQRVQQLLLTNSVFHDTEDDAGTSHQTSEPIPDHTSDPNFEPASEPIPEPTREPTPESNPRKKSKTTKSSSINADDLAHDMRKALQYLIKGNEGPTVAVCSEKLKLVGLDPVDPLFLAAFHIFGVSTGMREAWMALPDIPDVEGNGSASDREYMNRIRDEIAEQHKAFAILSIQQFTPSIAWCNGGGVLGAELLMFDLLIVRCNFIVELTHYGNYAIIARISYYDCLTRELHVLELWEDVKYQVKPLVIYTSTKSEDSLSVALQQNDGAREVPAVKLMKSSIFSYEQAWHSSITRDLVSHILEFSMHLLKGINFAAEPDCFLSLALVARQNNYVRPTLTAEAVLDIRNGRHATSRSLCLLDEFGKGTLN
ncbi:hypothetical protein E3N88_16472 [Mikania micrantha]|uniref:Myb/SANT-like domain-containing protein n=1 Tax=Mikania micrantha TaxID=192012 RepID=A0A5N6NYW3_9ASTR|nr:hypothetical protein E3N88_16472 [Mikania micrantha]